jgi:hypothetical protein
MDIINMSDYYKMYPDETQFEYDDDELNLYNDVDIRDGYILSNSYCDEIDYVIVDTWVSNELNNYNIPLKINIPETIYENESDNESGY